MTHRTLYVETSVWGMIPMGQPREMRLTTLRFLRRPRLLYISSLVIEELEQAPPSIRKQIEAVIRTLTYQVLEVTPECKALAEEYIDKGVVPAKKLDDAIHVAIATIYNLDVLVSWNHRHMTNVRKTEMYRGVNLVAGYSHIPLILTPLEVLHE